MPTSSLYYKQPIVILDDSASTNQTSASLVLYGGLSAIENSSIYGILSVQNNTQSTSFNNGSLVVDGGAGIEKNLNVGEQLNVSGDSVFVAAVTVGSLYVTSIGNLKLPIGDGAEGQDGLIRYNDTDDRYEGYVTDSWMPLGGVIDKDKDTRISAEESPDEDYLRFYTAGEERFYIDNSGGSTFLGTITTGSINISQGSTLYYSTVNMTPNLSDIVAEKSFEWSSESSTTMTDEVITGLEFENASVRGFNALICMDAQNDDSPVQYANYEIKGIQKGDSGEWYINSSFVGDNTGIIFSIVNIDDKGKLQFSSPTNEFTIIKMKFKAQTTSIPE
jgi:hypothetical protein